ncbi:MAG: ATP-binding domain-containing protein [Dehalococcoidia bacterium]|nr:ATP-binding domain-containing protein [Dehalococcoidia bacterium]
MPARIDEILRNAHASMTGFGGAQAAEIERLLAPRVRVKAPLAVQAREADREILTLTEGQFNVLGLLSRLRRVAVSGAAGSGKSLLAAEQARRLAAQGLRTLFLCFNRPLADALTAGLEGDEHLRVHTFYDFCHRMAQEADLLPDEFIEERPPEFFERLPDLLLEALQALPETRFDAVVVDEGQDFEADWWSLVELGLADPTEGILYVVHGDAQRVTAGASTLPADLAPIPLGENLRNTQTIHAAASTFAGTASTPMGPEGRPVDLVELEPGSDLVGTLSRVLHRLIRDEQFRPEEIVILSGRGQKTTALASVERIGAYRCSGLPVTPGAVAVDTIRRFKGLDSRVVVLVEVDHLLESPELLYVGITRARAPRGGGGQRQRWPRCAALRSRSSATSRRAS